MAQHRKFSRRSFMTLGCGALCTAVLTGGCASRLGTDVTASSCPFGEVNDPYPGKCHRYLDENGTGYCDYSESQEVVSATTTRVVEDADQTDEAANPAGSDRASSRCPKGLVNDPYPGRCHHYTDRNGSGYCDLSESA